MSSQAHIVALQKRGFTDSSIGRAVGRDSSYIYQIRTGKKPGVTLESSLRSVLQGGQPSPKPGAKPLVEAQRRKVPNIGRAGMHEAGVRKTPATYPFKLGTGQSAALSAKRGEKSLLKFVSRLPLDARIKVFVTFKNVKKYRAKGAQKNVDVTILGLTQEDIRAGVEQFGSLRAYLTERANDDPEIDGASGAGKVRIVATVE